ncbi:MAG: DUF4384 domain-containing protein [Flavobacteriales bacterium]|nr:DUF4384 domain-containing protein [Flavobacteriales bacterium]
MPIRIEPDNNRGNYNPRRGGGGGGGGGGSIMQFLPMIIGLFGRNPKLLIIIAVLAGAYMMFSKGGCSASLPGSQDSISSIFSTGTLFDQEKYSATEIFEPLADNKKNPLPDQVSLLSNAPTRKNQGQQGSCVAWASAYAARTILESKESGSSPDQCTFSPSFLYNQIALENCQGAYLPEAMKVMKGTGLAPFRDMPYNENDCSSEPSSMALRKAADFKIDGFQRLTSGGQGVLDDPGKVDMLAIKQNLAQGAPVVIGMMVGGTFMQNMVGEELWRPADSDYDMRGFGGHAMCVIGYDDYKYGNVGGFQIMNSWGNEWGKDGVAWVAYPDFAHFVKEAYGLYPMGDANAPKATELSLELGIMVRDAAGQYNSELSFMASGEDGVFRTTGKLKKGENGGDRFRLMVTNNLECYVYIFGEETDGSVYTLFPYTEKHSPFCGITGTRLFPKDHNLYPDDKGNLDRFAVVVSDAPIDYDAFASQLNAASGNLRKRLDAALNNNGATWQAGEGINTRLPWSKDAGTRIGAVIEVQK